MWQRYARRTSSWQTTLGRLVAVAAAVGGMSVAAFAPGVAAAATSPKTATVISTAKDGKSGTILVAGTAVYTLKPSKHACTGKCLKAWPPVILPQGVSSPTAGSGVDSAKLGTTATSDGSMQITYAGKPLYWFVKDKKPGQVKGNLKDKWGKWHTVVTAKSHAAKSSNSTPATTNNAGTGGTAF